MELAQCRLVTDDVEGLAGFYARLLGVPTALNEYYVEIQAGSASVGFSRRRFTEHREADGPAAPGPAAPGPAASGPAASSPGRRDDIILDFGVDDVDAEYPRIAALDVDWVMPPTTQPWGNRSMMFRDPAGNLINVFSRGPVLSWIHDARGHDDHAGVGPGALTAVLTEAPGRALRGFRIPWSLAPHYREEMTMHDHRKLGRELGLFDTDPLIGAGLPYCLPAGAAIRHALEEYIIQVERRASYQHVCSPVLAPVQLAVLPVVEAQLPEAEALAGRAVQDGLRAVVARPEAGSLGARIHASRLVPYQAVIGTREAAAGQVSLRLRDGRRVPALSVDEVLGRIGERVAARSTELWEEGAMAV